MNFTASLHWDEAGTNWDFSNERTGLRGQAGDQKACTNILDSL
jgi:hypothetical protein